MEALRARIIVVPELLQGINEGEVALGEGVEEGWRFTDVFSFGRNRGLKEDGSVESKDYSCARAFTRN